MSTFFIISYAYRMFEEELVQKGIVLHINFQEPVARQPEGLSERVSMCTRKAFECTLLAYLYTEDVCMYIAFRCGQLSRRIFILDSIMYVCRYRNNNSLKFCSNFAYSYQENFVCIKRLYNYDITIRSNSNQQIEPSDRGYCKHK
jgi:hypothetical protein